MFRVTDTAEPRKPITIGSIGWRRSVRCINATAKWISRRPMIHSAIAPTSFSPNGTSHVVAMS